MDGGCAGESERGAAVADETLKEMVCRFGVVVGVFTLRNECLPLGVRREMTKTVVGFLWMTQRSSERTVRRTG
jgi:hypothetical protein